MKNSKMFLAFVLSLLMLLSACSGDSSDTVITSPGGDAAISADGSGDTYRTLTIGTTESSTASFDRFAVHGYGSNLIGCFLVWDSLFEINPDTKEVEPLMVDTYEWEDNVTLKIKLRDDIYASDGEQLTGEDVLWSMERAIVENSIRSSYYLAYDFENSFVDANDPLIFTLKYNYPYGPGLSYLIDPIYPKDWGTTTGTDDAVWFDQPNGSGPYECMENISGSHMSFKLKDDWREDTTGMADEIIVKYYTEQSTLYIDLENGDLDIAYDISPTDAERLIAGEHSDTISYQIASKNDVYMVILPEYTSLWDDINMRKAFSYAIDWEAVADATFGCLKIEARSLLPANVKYFVDMGGTFEYDPDKARELIAAAGYSDGEIVLDCVCTNDTRTVTINEAIQAYLAAVGITMNIQSYDMPTAIPILAADQGTTILTKNSMEGSPSLDPDQIWDTLGENSTLASGRSTDPKFNEYLNVGLRNVDEDIRAEAYRNAQEWMYANYRHFPICEAGYCYAWQSTVITSANVVSPSAPNLKYVRFS